MFPNSRLFRYIFLITLTVLAGCSERTPEDMLDNYASRLARVLDVEYSHPVTPHLPLFPERRERIIETTEIREGLLDLLTLSPCELLPLIAERNSSLGKVYPPSQKLAYEVKFYILTKRCLDAERSNYSADPKLLQLLNELSRIKRINLAAEIWNGIYTSSELEKNFSIGDPPLNLIPDGTTNSTLSAFATLSQVTSLITTPDIEEIPSFISEIEPLYQVMHNNRSGARILSSLNLLTVYLDYSAGLINKRLNERNLCFANKPNQQAQILKNVFYKFYAGEVQPYMGYIHKHAERWFNLNQDLITTLKADGLKLSVAVNVYFNTVVDMRRTDSLWANYERARDKHTKAWQKVLKQCGMMPSANNQS